MLDPLTKMLGWKLYKTPGRTPPPWCWPLPRLGNRDPIAQRSSDESEHWLAVDIGYSAEDVDDLSYVPVYAAQDGLVRLAVDSADGNIIVLDHGGTWSTHYAHLDRMFVNPQSGGRRRRFEFVPGGAIIGYAARSPVHIRFELRQWTNSHGYAPVDPLSTMPQWTIYPQHDEPALPVATALESRKDAP